MIDRILGDSLALAERAHIVGTRWSRRMEPCSDWRLLKHMRRGWTGPPCWRRGSEAPRCWWPPGALGVGSHDPCLSRESWWICCWPRRRPHRIWLTHFWALGPGLSLGDFEGLCPSWLKVISERDHSWDVEGGPPTVVEIFTKILTCSWSARHSQLTHARACVVSSSGGY